MDARVKEIYNIGDVVKMLAFNTIFKVLLKDSEICSICSRFRLFNHFYMKKWLLVFDENLLLCVMCGFHSCPAMTLLVL